MARGHALGDVGNNLGNAAHDVGRKDLVGMKHAQKTCPLFSDVRGGIIRIMNEQGSLCLRPRQVTRRFSIISRQFKPEFHNISKTVG